jgi:hypothetical protein
MSLHLAERPQTSLEERILENPTLEQALEDRQKTKERAANARKAHKQNDERAKALIEETGIGIDEPIRVGRFVIRKRHVDGREISFETGPRTQLSIRTDKPG